MGQARSRYEKPGGFWYRRKLQAAVLKPPQENPIKMSSPPPEPEQSSVQMDQSSALADQSSITADTTPVSAAPHPDKHGDTMPDAPDERNDSDQPTQPVEGPVEGPAEEPAEEPAEAPPPCPNRPALKRKFTPPHLINIWSRSAWQTEHAYSNVHDHIRAQQAESDHTSPAVRRTELDVYKAADSCTLSLEYLVGHFSTKFFHYTGPENIIGMMATIDADATALDDLRLKQLRLANYGYSLEKKIIQTEGHIRELAELAKLIRDNPAAGQEEDQEEEEGEDEDADAEGDSDPEANGRGVSSWPND